MKVLIQLLSFEPGLQVLDLLHFPSNFLRPAGASLNVSLWSSGRKATGRFKQPSALIDWITRQTFNEIWITCKPSQQSTESGRLVRLDQRLMVSPKNHLWAGIGETKAETRTGENIRSSAETVEHGIRWHKLDAYPTLLETTLEFSCDLGHGELAEWIAEAVPESLNKLTISGVGEVVGDLGIVANVLDNLAPWRRAISMLDDLFAGLYPLLIGPATRCSELASALALRGPVHLASVKRGSISVLSLGGEVLSDSRARELASPWLVPRDATTKNLELDSNKGEIRLGGHLYYTKKRFDELMAERLIPSIPEGYEYRPLVRPEDCHTLGVDEKEMLVAFSQVGNKVFEQIGEHIALRPADEPLSLKVVEAYREVYRERGFWLFGRKFEEVLSFLEERYFKGISVS